MKIIIQSLGFKASESLENFIRAKLNAIKNDHILGANVVLYKGPVSNPENDYCEIRLQMPGHDHFVKKHSLYFETSVKECTDILIQMINKAKQKTGNQKMDKGSVMVENNFEEEGKDTDLDDILN